jgi:hypothetical protein
MYTSWDSPKGVSQCSIEPRRDALQPSLRTQVSAVWKASCIQDLGPSRNTPVVWVLTLRILALPSSRHASTVYQSWGWGAEPQTEPRYLIGVRGKPR